VSKGKRSLHSCKQDGGTDPPESPSWAEVVNRNRRMGFGGVCTAVGLSKAGSACKDMLDLGFSLSRTGIMRCELKGGGARCPG